jgi:hypothetical protein
MAVLFPGIDPFVEYQEWEDFHNRFNNALADALHAQVRPRYFVRVQRRVYVEHPTEFDAQSSQRVGDVSVVVTGADLPRGVFQAPATGATAPVICEIAMPQERRETVLVIREQETQEVVTVVETLSPSNKRRGGDGWREYMEKRDEILCSQTHLVELDLLRGGSRLPMVKALPPGDYFAIVSRAERRPNADVYAWTLRDSLPQIRVPLLRGDADVRLDLQQVLSSVYARADYHLSMDYHAELHPSPSPDDQKWLGELLRRLTQ